MASGGLIGALRVSLGLDSAQFEAGTKRARSIAQRDATAIQKSLSGIKGSLNGLIAGATITAFATATKRALDYAGGLGEVSQQLGVTTKDLQVYRYVASQVGVEQDTMDASLAKLTRTMGQAADGSKAQVNAFRDLGIAIKDSNGKLYTAGEILPRLADAFARIKDPATRARLEAELFGRAGQKLDPLLTQGARGVEALTKRAEELGLVLGDDLIKSADEASDKLAEMQKQLEVGFARAVANSANAIVGLANAFASLTSQVISFINKYPELSGALAGAAAGARFGVPGALAGAGLGLLAGDAYSRSRDDGNMDPKFRAGALKQSLAKWRDAKRGNTDPTGKLGAGAPQVQRARSEAAWKEVERQWALFNQSKAGGAGAAPALPSPGDLPTVSGGGGGRKGPKDRSAELLERFNKEMADLADDQLQLQQEITTDVHERARIEHLRIDTQKSAYEHDVDSREKQGELDATQAQALKIAYETNATREHTLVNWKLDDELVEQELDLTRSRLENANDLLQGELASARTQADRRRIQLEILENERQLQVASLEAIKAKHTSNDAEYQIAQEKLDQLNAETAQRAGAIRRDTMGPMETYLDSLPRTAEELKERFAAIKVDALNNGLDIASRNVLRLKGFAGDLFNQLIADVIRLNLQSTLAGGGGLLGSLGKILGLASSGLGSGGGMNMSGWDGAVAGIMSGDQGLPTFPSGWEPYHKLPGLAGGGTFRAGGVPGVDRNILSVGGIPRARVSANENITVSPANDRAVARVVIEEHPGFAARVVGISGNVSVETARASSVASFRRGRQRLG